MSSTSSSNQSFRSEITFPRAFISSSLQNTEYLSPGFSDEGTCPPACGLPLDTEISFYIGKSVSSIPPPSWDPSLYLSSFESFNASPFLEYSPLAKFECAPPLEKRWNFYNFFRHSEMYIFHFNCWQWPLFIVELKPKNKLILSNTSGSN